MTHYLGKVKTFIILYGKYTTMSTKFYQNRLGFVDDVTKTFGVFLGSQFHKVV